MDQDQTARSVQSDLDLHYPQIDNLAEMGLTLSHTRNNFHDPKRTL